MRRDQARAHKHTRASTHTANSHITALGTRIVCLCVRVSKLLLCLPHLAAATHGHVCEFNNELERITSLSRVWTRMDVLHTDTYTHGISNS